MNPMQKFEKTIQINNRKARYYDFNACDLSDYDLGEDINNNDNNNKASANKPILHFYGGNGFPVGVYEPLLKALSQKFHVISLAMQGYWYDEPTDKVLTRAQDAQLLIQFLDKMQNQSSGTSGITPVIGVGHSQGATATAMASAQRPDLFSQLYLIDPVTFTKAQVLLYNLIPNKILLTQQPFKVTNTKQADWGSIENYYQTLRRTPAYRRINNNNLRLFAKNSLIPKPQDSNDFKNLNTGYTLLFKPQQELASYYGTPYIDPALKTLNKKSVPYTLILAKPSVFNSHKVRKVWRRFVPKDSIITLPDYGHLLPLEAPEQCAKIIIDSYLSTQ